MPLRGLLFILLQRLLQQEEGAADIVLVQHIREADLIAPHSGRRVEARGRRHHQRLPRLAFRRLLVLPAEVREAPGAEIFGVFHRQLGDGVERAHRHRRIAAFDLVDPVDQGFPPLDVFVIDLPGVRLGPFDRGLRDELADQRRREPRLAELHHGLPDLPVLRDQRADADAALGVALRHGVDQDRVLLDSLQVHRGDVRRTRVDEFAVHLVGEEVQGVFLHEVPDPVHLLLGVQVARRVVGVADQDRLRALVDQFLEFLDLRQAEALLDRRHDRADHGARGHGERHVVGVRRLRDDDFVARVQAAQEGEEYRLAAAARDDDFVRREFDLVAVIVADQRLPQRAVALRRAVFQRLAVDVLQHVQRLLRRRQVRLTDVQLVDLDPALLRRIRQRRQLPDRRQRHLHPPLRNLQFVFTHIAFVLFLF